MFIFPSKIMQDFGYSFLSAFFSTYFEGYIFLLCIVSKVGELNKPESVQSKIKVLQKRLNFLPIVRFVFEKLLRRLGFIISGRMRWGPN